MRKGIIGKLMGASLASSTAMATVMVAASPAYAQEAHRQFDIPSQPLASALVEFSRQSDLVITASSRVTKGKTAPAVKGNYAPAEALNLLLADSGLHAQAAPNGGFVVELGNGLAGAKGAGLSQGTASSLGNSDNNRDIVVTGTHLGKTAELVSPNGSLSRDVLKSRGLPDIESALLKEPAIFAGSFTAEGTQAVVPGGIENTGVQNYAAAASVDIHGLGASATLPLFNGHRLPGGSSGAAPDISLIPSIALESIAIVRDGASSIYGSDAVAGVVNFVPRAHFDGIEADLTAGTVTSGSYWASQAGAIIGKQTDKFGLVLAYQFDHSNSMDTSERAATRSGTLRTLFPRQNELSGYGRFDLDLAPTLHFYSELVGARRDFNTFQADGPGRDLFKVSTWQILSNTGLSYDLSPAWNATAGISFAQNKTNSRMYPRTSSTMINNENLDLELTIRGRAFPLPAGRVQLAFGAESLKVHGDFQTSGIAPQDNTRRVNSFYAESIVPLISKEMRVPAVESLAVVASARYDHYSDLGGTTNPKIGVLWTLQRGLRLRGTYSTSFRAPSFFDENQSGFFADALSVTDSSRGGANSLVMFLGGSSGLHLKPETATNLSVGADILPAAVRGLSAHIDYYNVNFRNRIAAPHNASTNILDPGAPDTQPFVIHNPSPALINAYMSSPQFNNFSDFPDLTGIPFDALIDDRTINLSIDKVSGIDTNIQYETQTALGDLNLSNSSEYILHYDVAAAPGVPARDLAGTVFFPPRFRSRTGLGWRRDGWNVDFFWNYSPSYKDNQIPAQRRRIASNNTFDMSIVYRLSNKGLALTFSANNIFDKAPPYVTPVASSYAAYDAANASALGRYVSLGMIAKW